MNAKQLGLGLALPVSYAREDFLEAPGNAAALGWIERWPDWPGGALLLHGPAGSGKTHLGHVWAAKSGARLLQPEALTAETVAALGEAPLALDDAERCADPAALFHLINLMRERGQPLLLLSGAAPAAWPHRLPDLVSRLKAMPGAAIAEPDDALLGAVLVKLFADRQLGVGEDLVAYLLPRIERSFHAARDWVARLDAAALAEQRPVTVALARRLLEAEQAPRLLE